MKFASRLVSFDAAPGDPFRPISTPIYQTATFEQEHTDLFGEYDYSRSGNPTRSVLEKHLATLENGTRGFCFSSGMAAIATVTKLLRSGDEILADNAESFHIMVSFGSVNSSICLPVKMSHASAPPEVRAERNLPADLLRLSVGIEDGEDLIADLDRAIQCANVINHRKLGA
jgi:cystathionine beta-lyase/cystathionine gamma-synthase